MYIHVYTTYIPYIYIYSRCGGFVTPPLRERDGEIPPSRALNQLAPPKKRKRPLKPHRSWSPTKHPPYAPGR